MKKGTKIAIGAAAVIAALYFMPFVTVEVTDSFGRTIRAPFGSHAVSVDQDDISFQSLRSAYALKKDGENALHSYKEEKCYGRTYYYDAGNDVSYTGVESSGVLPSKVTYDHENGHACAGWTTNDEIAWPYGDIADADLNITIADAEDKGWLVVDNGSADNIGVYNDFANMIKQGVYCYMRTLVIDGEERSLVDIQLLETAADDDKAETAADVSDSAKEDKDQADAADDDPPYRVIIRHGNEVDDQKYARVTETEENGHTYVSAYKENSRDAEEIRLFEIK